MSFGRKPLDVGRAVVLAALCASGCHRYDAGLLGDAGAHSGNGGGKPSSSSDAAPAVEGGSGSGSSNAVKPPPGDGGGGSDASVGTDARTGGSGGSGGSGGTGGSASGDDSGTCITGCSDPSLGWQKLLTFDGSHVAADLSAFPVLVRISDADLAKRGAANGSDVYFVDDAQSMKLAHELESFDATTGALVAWVRLPLLAGGKDTSIRMRYGDGGQDRSNAAAVFSDHHFVWHLAQDPGPGGKDEIRDSTGRAHGTASSGMSSSDLVDAVIGKGVHFDGSSAEITFTSDFTGTGPSTFSAWVDQQMDSDGASDTIVSFGAGSTNQARFFYSAHTMTHNLVGGFYSDDVDSKTSIVGSGWHHVVWVWDGSNSSFYVDGARAGSPLAHTGANTMGSAGKIGNAIWAARFLRGQLDEVRVSNSVHSAAWIKTEYDNQRTGSTLLKSVGPEEPVTVP